MLLAPTEAFRMRALRRVSWCGCMLRMRQSFGGWMLRTTPTRPVARMAGHGLSMECLGREDGVGDGGWHACIGSVVIVGCTVVVFDRSLAFACAMRGRGAWSWSVRVSLGIVLSVCGRPVALAASVTHALPVKCFKRGRYKLILAAVSPFVIALHADVCAGRAQGW